MAKLRVTHDDHLKSHWKFDESKYAEAFDEKRNNSGTLRNLITVGESSTL